MEGILGRVGAGVPFLPGHAASLNATDPAWRLTAATVPTRWPVPRPDEGRPSAAAGGSGGLAIRCSCRVGLLCRPAELAAVGLGKAHVTDQHGLLRKRSNK